MLYELFLLVGAVLGIIAFKRCGDLMKQRAEAQNEISSLKSRLLSVELDLKRLKPAEEARSVVVQEATTQIVREVASPAEPEAGIALTSVQPHSRPVLTPAHNPALQSASGASFRTGSVQPSKLDIFTASLKENWMVWLGGFSVALSGIFLAQYSIEKGLLGPLGRLSLGFITGLLLHIGAEYCRRRNRGTHPAFAALAGGGSITLFATLVAALHFYELISPGLSFFLLAVVALATMALALVHGPIVAALGILGAYLVPVLVSTGEGSVLVALAYSLIISASALLLLRYVYRDWLWWGMLTGALVWWLITLHAPGADGFRGFYLSILAYLLLAIPGLDWKLGKQVLFPDAVYDSKSFTVINGSIDRQMPLVMLLLIVAQCMSIQVQTDFNMAILQWSPLALVLLWASNKRENFYPLPWILLLAQCAAWISTIVVVTPSGKYALAATENTQVLWYCIATGAFYVVLALRNFGTTRFGAVWASLATVSPVILLATAWLMTGGLITDWIWALTALAVGCGFVALAAEGRKRSDVNSIVVWLLIAGHFALALAAAFVLDTASLTIALALLIISLTWIIDRFKLPELGWLLKVVIMIVIARLTFNPWLTDYPVDIHWTLWTYGGAALCAFAGCYLLKPYGELRRWTEGAFLHLFVLFCWTEIRYWLYDGAVFTNDYTLLEASLYTSFFGVLSLVYFQRGLRSESLEKIYTVFSQVLLGFSVLNYAFIMLMTLTSQSWQWQDIGQTPVFNLMLLAYGAPVLIAVLVYRFHQPVLKKAATVFTTGMAFIFITLEIRHLWQGELRLAGATGSGELYTYSIAWLLLAIIAILAGAWRYGNNCSRAGLGLLALVIAKIFLVDMSDLDGLLRVASFMGLGLGMLAVSFLYQKLKQQQAE